jgi:DNA repair protein RadD
VSCCILARPTKKMGLFRQMIGRVLRPDDGKTDAIVLDHSGAVFRHGFVEDRVEWTLDPDRHAKSPTHEQRGEHYPSRLLECSQCSAVRVAGEPCPHCGFLPQRPPKPVVFADGDLAEVGRDRRRGQNNYNRDEWHGMLAYIADERGYQRGWIAHQYKQKFGSWPPWGATPTPIPPSHEVRSWVRSRMIAYARRRSA